MFAFESILSVSHAKINRGSTVLFKARLSSGSIAPPDAAKIRGFTSFWAVKIQSKKHLRYTFLCVISAFLFFPPKGHIKHYSGFLI